jgi:hypothetical protein
MNHKKLEVRRERVGDEMVITTVERHNAVVDFQKILDACEVVPDPDADAPWEMCDGWEHLAVSESDLEYTAWGHFETVTEKKSKWVAHYNEDDVVGPGSSRKLIIVGWATVDGWQGEYDWWRGEPRQVYEERLAEVRRDATEQLKRWYSEGWQYWGVRCEFLDVHESVWGVQTRDDSDDDPYLDEVREEVALEVAGELEEIGYTVVNRPDKAEQLKERRRQNLRHRIARQLGFEDADAYRRWIESERKVGPDITGARQKSGA